MLLQSFRSRAAALFGSISFALALLLSLVIGSIAAERIANDQGDALHSMARSVGDVLAEGLHDRLLDIELIAASPEAQRFATETAPLHDTLERLRRARPSLAWIGAVDAGGVVATATGDLLVGQNVGERPWFKAALNGSHVGDVHLAKLLAKYVPAGADGGPPRFVDFAAPVRAPDGRVVAVIGAHGRWDWAGEVVARLKSPRALDQDVQVFIVDRTGVPLYRPMREGTVVPELKGPAPRPTLPAVMVWPDGVRYLTTAMPLQARSSVSDLGWTIVVRQPEAVAMRGATRARDTVIGLGLLAALAAMGLTWLIAARLSRPLQAMSLVAQRIGGGDFDARIPADRRGGSEVMRLGQALQGMTQSLLNGQAALRNANELLEARVLERTEELAAANAELQSLASRDGLTGLFNRRMADQRLADEILRHRRTGQTLSVLLVDVDHFKQVNDRFGHTAGDDALRAVAACLRDACRGTDVVARFGGEEFIVLLPETPAPQALLVGEMLRSQVASLSLPAVGKVTISLGLADAPPQPLGIPNAWTAAELVRRADAALYSAKACGRDRVVRFEADTHAVG